MATTTAKKPSANPKLKVSEMSNGDVFSEVSHYTLLSHDKEEFKFLHHGSNEPVVLSQVYVEELLHTGNQYQKEVEVGKEDKLWTDKRIEEWQKAQKTGYDVKDTPKAGDVMIPGIRTIWENIHSAHVFKVCFQKQDEALTAKKLDELREAQISAALESIDKAMKGKKGVAAAAMEQLKNIQQNPILPYAPGEMRVLVGYKVQFTSRDGRYQCMDMEKKALRPVNINTIEWLVFDGVKYIVK